MNFATLKNMVIVFMFLSVSNAFAQCGTSISTFPYIEDFETSAAWTSGGLTNSRGTVVNDWAWGTPNKPVINSAGSGQKCWVVGGLTGLTYGSGERSYIQSPCFDFTNLAHPYISFLAFWESEWKYDGAVLQSSTDGGTTWTNVGSVNDPTDCLNANWYNHNPISGLGTETLTGTTYPALTTTTDGWCGNIQSTSGNCQGGNGSGRWVLAKHCMSNLAGLPSVTFRFAFGAGTTCNTFNGFAIDSVSIREAPANTADFNFACVNTNTVSFTGITSLCPTAYSWNFSDPASGANNTSSALSPSHTFSAPGSYNVTFTNSGGCNAPASISKTITIIGDSISKTDISCFNANNGSATVIASGASGYTYAWSTTPAQSTATISNLSAGTYTVSVNATGACQAVASVSIVNPDSLYVLASLQSDSCALNSGSIALTVNGGTAPFTYIWSPTQAGNPNHLNALAAGVYSLTVTDAHGCSLSEAYTIDNTCGTDSLVFPTAFTPNGDGKNDVFLPSYIGSITNYQIHIYNRWGQLVFESTDVNAGWNGLYKNAQQPGGIYTYFASYTDKKPREKQGTFTLLR